MQACTTQGKGIGNTLLHPPAQKSLASSWKPQKEMTLYKHTSVDCELPILQGNPTQVKNIQWCELYKIPGDPGEMMERKETKDLNPVRNLSPVISLLPGICLLPGLTGEVKLDL